MFRNPATEQIENTVGAEGRSYTFTIQPSNESLLSCMVNSEESGQVMIAGRQNNHALVTIIETTNILCCLTAAIPQYTAGITAIRQYIYSDIVV